MATLGESGKAARRAAEVRIRALERTIDFESRIITETSEGTIRRSRETINELRNLIEQTRLYSGGKRISGRTKEERKRAIDRLEAYKESIYVRGSRSRVARSNAIFEENVRQVSRGEHIDTMSETEMRVFLRATQNAWEGGNVRERYVDIMEKTGISDMQGLFEAIKSEYARIASVIDKMQNDEPLTAEEKELMQQLKREDDEQEKKYSPRDGSPTRGSIASLVRPLSIDELINLYNRHQNG